MKSPGLGLATCLSHRPTFHMNLPGLIPFLVSVSLRVWLGDHTVLARQCHTDPHFPNGSPRTWGSVTPQPQTSQMEHSPSLLIHLQSSLKTGSCQKTEFTGGRSNAGSVNLPPRWERMPQLRAPHSWPIWMVRKPVTGNRASMVKMVSLTANEPETPFWNQQQRGNAN